MRKSDLTTPKLDSNNANDLGRSLSANSNLAINLQPSGSNQKFSSVNNLNEFNNQGVNEQGNRLIETGKPFRAIARMSGLIDEKSKQEIGQIYFDQVTIFLIIFLIYQFLFNN